MSKVLNRATDFAAYLLIRETDGCVQSSGAICDIVRRHIMVCLWNFFTKDSKEGRKEHLTVRSQSPTLDLPVELTPPRKNLLQGWMKPAIGPALWPFWSKRNASSASSWAEGQIYAFAVKEERRRMIANIWC